MTITARQYRILSDHPAVYRFMTEIYERDWRNGVPAPFLEYALSSNWMDKSYTHRNRLWFDGGRIAAFVFTESPVTDIYFSLRPGYEFLADEMVAYARMRMPDFEGRQRLILFTGQDALRDAAARAGYERVGGHVDNGFDFGGTLSYELPEGFRFVPTGGLDLARVTECCWKGFGHEAEEGPWDGDASPNEHLMQAPHATPQYAVAVENGAGEYVCYAGMWWTPENRLAYMEPLCTVPRYRRRGLAAAALTELYRRMKPLGATHMTGGADVFYTSIGFAPMIEWNVWKRN